MQLMEKDSNIEVYYCLPGHELDNGIRMLKGDTDLQLLVTIYKDLSVIHLSFVNNLVPLLSYDSECNIICKEVNALNEEIPVVDENYDKDSHELVEQEKDGVSSDDSSQVSLCPSWMVEQEKDGVSSAEHRFCLRHMYNIFKAKFKGLELKKWFWNTASTYSVKQHHQVMKEIQRISPKIDDKITTFEWMSNVLV
ncbi:hypothetical protein C2S51_020081 [Perilla frutescens var. frutescens]|nr:hypothetical protein C2S51_020081 [Perilla frutescens var. frutescens]